MFMEVGYKYFFKLGKNIIIIINIDNYWKEHHFEIWHQWPNMRKGLKVAMFEFLRGKHLNLQPCI
jgi:hypothetical protein